MHQLVRVIIACLPLLGSACGVLPSSGTPDPPVPPTATAGPQGVRLRFAFKPGEVRLYAHDMSLAVDAPAGKAAQASRLDMTMRLRYRVLEVHEDHSATLVAGYDRLAFSANGQTREVPEAAGAGVRMRVSATGSTSEVRVEKPPLGGQGELDAEQLAQMMMSEYPSRALLVGESFDRQFPLSLPGESEPLALSSRVALAGLLTIRGQQAARLMETVAMPLTRLPGTEELEVSGRMGGTLTHYVELESGWPISGDGTLTIDLSGDSAARQKSAALSMRITQRYQREQ